MPAYNFVRMRDEDLADIIAYLRTVPVARKGLPHPGLPFEVRREASLSGGMPPLRLTSIACLHCDAPTILICAWRAANIPP